MNTALKQALDALFKICDKKSGQSQNSDYVSFERKQLQTELLDFLSYLSSSDGIISSYETAFIADYIGKRMTSEELRKYVDDRNTYSTQFEQTVPETLKRLVFEDWDKEKTGADAKAYVEVVNALGKEFIVCDGEVDENEVQDLATYSTTLESYLTRYYGDAEELESSIDVSEIHAGEIIPKFDANGEKIESLDELMRELNQLVGLKAVKKDVTSLIHLQGIRKLRRDRGLKDIPLSNHLVFYGNPGTGKTTVARLLAKIYRAIGILSQGQLVEVDRSGLVAGYVGQTALKMQDVIKSALGGVLFIDEAYELSAHGNENDYGQEAINTLLKAMEDHRDDFVVIVAGYPELMGKFIDSNPGLRSRFNKYINFEDYSVEELVDIFETMCKKAGYVCDGDALETVTQTFRSRYEKRSENFANAREVRNFFERAIMRQADRLFDVENPSNQELMRLEMVDVQDVPAGTL